MYPTRGESKLNRDGPDEKHVGTGVAITIPRAEAPEAVLRVWRKEALPSRDCSAGQVRTESGCLRLRSVAPASGPVDPGAGFAAGATRRQTCECLQWQAIMPVFLDDRFDPARFSDCQ